MVRRLVDAWNRPDIEALLDLGGPEIAFVNSPTAVEPGTRRGTDEVVAAVRKRNRKLIRAEILGFGVTEVETALEAAGLSE